MSFETSPEDPLNNLILISEFIVKNEYYSFKIFVIIQREKLTFRLKLIPVSLQSLILQILTILSSRTYTLKYQRSTTTGCKYMQLLNLSGFARNGTAKFV